MEVESWRLIVQLFSTVISLCALIAVVISLRQVNRSLASNAISGIYSELHEIHRVFISHPELRPYFFHNEKMPSEHESYLRARAIAEMFFDIFEHIYTLKNQASKEIQENFSGYVEHMCDSSIFLCDYLMENEDLIYPLELRKLIIERAQVHKIQEQNT